MSRMRVGFCGGLGAYTRGVQVSKLSVWVGEIDAYIHSKTD